MTRSLLIGWILATAAVFPQTAVPDSYYDKAVEAFQQGNLTDAEELLRAGLKARAQNARALDLLGVVLDAQKRYDEAETSYQRALALTPRSAGLLNNLGNHYLAQGDSERARAIFLKAVAIQPNLPNANLHLAQMSLAEKSGEKALEYVNRLPEEEQERAEVQLLRAQAFQLSGQDEKALDTLAGLETKSSGDPRLAFSIGLMYADWKRYADAEEAFTRALEAAPANFDTLYNLGLAAMRAGHLDRAQEVLEEVLRKTPNDVDCLVGLGQVYSQKGKNEKAIELLVQAERLAPSRPEVQLALANVTEKLGFYGDTAAAYDEYLKLRPNDEVARRERGFALVRSGNLRLGVDDLEWYLQKYPQDAYGLYELGIAEVVGNQDNALSLFNRALIIQPDLLPARYARALVNCEERRSTECLEDLKILLTHQPENVRLLDELGKAYLVLEQYQEAVKVLRQAADLAPQDSAVLMHYSLALRGMGEKQKAIAMLEAFKKVANEDKWRPRAGLLEYLNLPPSEREARYRGNLEKVVADQPDNARARAEWGRFLLSQRKIPEALEMFRQARNLTSDPSLLVDCGRTLFQYGRYEESVEYFRAAAALNPSDFDVRIDLALAVFHASGPELALGELDRISYEQRNGNYYLLRAQLLDSLGKFAEAVEALNQGFRTAPTRPDLYLQAALFLLKHSKYRECLALLQQATRIVPDARELLLVQAVTHRILTQLPEANRLLEEIQSRWPEWDLVYLVHGIVLETLHQSQKARDQLETAIALGSNDPAAYYYLALATIHAAPQETETLHNLISHLLELYGEDPYVQWLAGSDALSRKEYPAAIEYLTAALRILPDLAEAHYSLGMAYRALGERQKSNAELREFQRLSKESRESAPTAPLVRDLLFAVGQMGEVPSKAPLSSP